MGLQILNKKKSQLKTNRMHNLNCEKNKNHVENVSKA